MLATAGEECTEDHTPVSQHYHLEVTAVSSTQVYNRQKNEVVLRKKMGATRDDHIKRIKAISDKYDFCHWVLCFIQIHK